MRTSVERRPDALILAGVLIVFLAAFLRTAWLSDDAYITFRTIDNLLHGYGLRWNVAERVQSYTHPLWLMVLVPWHWATGEAYFSTLAISILVSLVVVASLARTGKSRGVALLVLTVLLFSRGFLDYATSGLENPLANLLLVAFFAVALRDAPSMSMLSLLASLLLMTRLDLAILVGPAFAMTMVRARGWRRPGLLAGLVPFLAWEAFSILYYGFPFPNTAYAKLKTGIATSELLPQGLLYLLDSLQRDPVTLCVITVAVIFSVAWPSKRTWPLAVGIVGYLLYVVSVGGDFMSGRFLVSPLIGSALLLLTTEWPRSLRRRWVPALLVLVVLLAFAPNPMPQHAAQTPRPDLIGESGIADERLAYFPTSGLPYYARGIPWPADALAEAGRQARRDGKRSVVFCCVGTLGYFAGPTVYVVDEVGLGDPLLARLPARSPWRIGHFARDVPQGYVASIESGENRVVDPGIAAYYERLRKITRGPIFASDRLRALARMNLGSYEPFIEHVTASAGETAVSR